MSFLSEAEPVLKRQRLAEDSSDSDNLDGPDYVYSEDDDSDPPFEYVDIEGHRYLRRADPRYEDWRWKVVQAGHWSEIRRHREFLHRILSPLGLC